MNKKMQVPFVLDWQLLRWGNSISRGLMTVNLLEKSQMIIFSNTFLTKTHMNRATGLDGGTVYGFALFFTWLCQQGPGRTKMLPGFSQHLLILGCAWPCQAAFLWLFWPQLSSSKVEGYGCRLPHICGEHIMCLMQKTNYFGAASWVSSSSGQGCALILALLWLLGGINTQVLYYPQIHVTDYANDAPVSLHLASNLHRSMNIRW